VIDSWARSGEPGSAQRAEILLKLMEVMYEKGNKAAKPNVQVYTSVINAWANSREPEAGEHADQLLARMEKLSRERGNITVKPNTITYTGKRMRHFIVLQNAPLFPWFSNPFHLELGIL